MIIEIESYKENEDGIFLTGKKHSLRELREMTIHIVAISDNNFIPLFCRNYNFDVIENYDGNVDVVIDLDINRVYQPRYED
jgi:hypothetical protein